jgi:hypothetical protein
VRWAGGILLAVCAWFAWAHFAERPVHRGAGVIAPAVPVQRDVDAPRALAKDGFRIHTLARFSLEARVLSRKNYCCFGPDRLAPVDVAFGWGRMSDERVLAALDITQGGRFYYYRWSGEPPIPPHEIVVSSANMHLIPATGSIEKKLKGLRAGEIVALEGYLVRVEGDGGFTWVSSLTREDSGNGACELVWVDAVSVR